MSASDIGQLLLVKDRESLNDVKQLILENLKTSKCRKHLLLNVVGLQLCALLLLSQYPKPCDCQQQIKCEIACNNLVPFRFLLMCVCYSVCDTAIM